MNQRLTLAGAGTAHVIFDEAAGASSPAPQLTVTTSPAMPGVFTGTGTPPANERALVGATATHPDAGVQIASFLIQSVTRLSDGSSVPGALTQTSVPPPTTLPLSPPSAQRYEQWTANEPVRVRFLVRASAGGRSAEQTHVVTFGGTAPPVATDLTVPEPGGDTTGPWVLSSSPSPGDRAIAPGEPIVLKFSEPIQDTQIDNGVSLSPSAPLAWHVFNENRTELTVAFAGLRPGQRYTMTVDYLYDNAGHRLNQQPRVHRPRRRLQRRPRLF